MNKTLYTRDILRLASSLTANDTLANDANGLCYGLANLHAPICGSKMAVNIAIDQDQRIYDAVFQVNSCALGQASTAIMKQNVKGLKLQSIHDVRDQLNRRLSGESEVSVPWLELEKLDVAIGYSARHGAILLPYDTIIAAFQSAMNHEGNGPKEQR